MVFIFLLFDVTYSAHGDLILQVEGGYASLATESEERRTLSPSSPSSLERAATLPGTTYFSTPHGGLFIQHSDHTYSYAYGPKGILGLIYNYYALGCAIFASIGGLLFGYDQGVIANVLVMRDFVERWPVSAWEKGLMSTYASWLCASKT